MGLLTRIWVGFTQLLGLILPFFGKAADVRRWSPGLTWFLRILLLALVLGLLWYINNYVLPKNWFLGRAPNRLVREIWLPGLFLLFFILSWLGWWLWQLLTPEAERSDFPDIDAAWEEGREALTRGGIDLTSPPLFLILGKPAGSIDALMQAAQIQFTVRQSPARGDAPLHVFANPEGIYVTCEGCSLSGKQAALLAAEGDFLGGGGSGESSQSSDENDDLMKTKRQQDLMSVRIGGGGEANAL